MSGIETTIFKLLAAHLDTYVQAHPIDVAYPGKTYTPVAGTPFLRPWFLPARTISADLNTTNDYTGILQIDVFWPSGQGTWDAMDVAAALIAHFPSPSVLYGDAGFNVRLEDPGYVSPALQEPGWLHIPVNVPYRVLS